MDFQDFRDAVRQAVERDGCWENGLRALAGNRQHIDARNAYLQGSVDLDQCLKAQFPNDPRWDYAIGYILQGQRILGLIEVHPGKPDDVLKKARWLRAWLNQGGRALDQWANEKCWRWVLTGPYHPPRTSRKLRQLSQEGIRPVRQVHLADCQER